MPTGDRAGLNPPRSRFFLTVFATVLLITTAMMGVPSGIAEEDDKDSQEWQQIKQLLDLICVNPQISGTVNDANEAAPADLAFCEDEEFFFGEDLEGVEDLLKGLLGEGPGDDLLPGSPALFPPCGFLGGEVTAGDPPAPVGNITITAIARSSTALQGGLYHRTTTGDDGSYELELYQGDYLVLALDERLPPQYLPAYQDNVRVLCGETTIQNFGVEEDDSDPTLPDVPGPGSLTVSLTEVIEGTNVTRPMGSSIEVQVSLVNLGAGPACTYAPAGPFFQNSNAQGNVTFSNLLPGEYCVRVTQSNWKGGEIQSIPVEAETTTEVELVTSKDRFRNLIGDIEDTLPVDGEDPAETEMPIHGANVTLIHPFYCPEGVTPAGVNYVCWAESGENGAYQVDDLPWDSEVYSLSVFHPAYEAHEHTFQMPALPPSPPPTTHREDVDLLRKHVSVMGSTQQGAIVNFTSVVLHHDDRWDDVWKFTTEFVADDGKINLELAWADYLVRVESGSETTYRCVSIGPDGRNLDFLDPEQGGVVLNGRAVDAQSMNDAGVEANVVIDSQDGERCITRSDQNGAFMPGLQPGIYSLTLHERDRHEKSKNVTLDDDHDVEVFLDWITREITGSVRLSQVFGIQLRSVVDFGPVPGALGLIDDQLNPVEPGVEVVCTTNDGVQVKTVTTNDPGNNLDLHLPRNNLFVCEVEDGVYHHASQDVNVPRSGNNNFDRLDLILEKRLWEISGIVRNAATGEPVEGALVHLGNLQEDSSFVFPHSIETGADGTYSIVIEIEEGPGGIKANQVLLLADHLDFLPSSGLVPIGSHPGATDEWNFLMVPETVGVPQDPSQHAVNVYCEQFHIHTSDIDGECEKENGDWTWYPPGGLPQLPPEES